MEEKELQITLEHIKDYEFKVTFDEQTAELIMDEPPPLGGGAGPNASKVLSAAIANCLSASLLFCLRKIRVEPTHFKTTVKTRMQRNEKGRLRIGSSHVTITLGLDSEGRQRINRCTDLFEDYCVVTQSVRGGIEVSVAVCDEQGQVIYDSTGKQG